MSKIYALYGKDERKIDNLKKRIRSYEKMKKDLFKRVGDLKKENQQLKEKLELSEKARKEGIELLKDSSLELNTREYGNLTVVNSDDLLEILDIDKGE